MANFSWKLARGRGNSPIPLVVSAVLALALILLGKTQSQLFDRARSAFTDWSRPTLVWAATPVNNTANWLGGIGRFFTVYSDNQRLLAENARLRQWQIAALALNERLKQDQALLHAVPDPSLSSVTARVIGRSSEPFLDTVILDAGKANGVKPGQVVIDSRGMVGRIFLTGKRTSWVILLSDLSSRIPVSIAARNIQAIMAGDNSPAPVLDTLAQRVAIKAGDQVVTSGDGGLIPPGIPVGSVYADGNLLRVALFASNSTSEDVRVVDFKLAPEHVPAPTPGDLPAAAAGFKPQPPPAPTIPAPANSPAPSTPKTAALPSKPAMQVPVPKTPVLSAHNPATQEDNTDDHQDQ